jgi:G:T-mismatch repair DNA endonuclease (very short patch repair protein)
MRDALQRQELERLGWTVLIIWECETKSDSTLDAVLDKIRSKTQDGHRTKSRLKFATNE